MSQFDVITIGNALIDAFLQIEQGNVHTKINKEEQTLCFRYGEKIHVDSCTFQPGGNACNVGVGLGRLRFSVGFFAEVGDDDFSKKIVTLLSKEPIDLSFLKQSPNSQSSFSVGINYENERTLFVNHVKRTHDFSFEQITSPWVYLTSLGEEWKHVYKNICDYTRATHAKLAFSPGTHQMEAFDAGRNLEEEKSVVLSVLRHAQLLFVNKDEAKRILSTNTDRIEELLELLQKLGPKIVSITDGENGSFCIDEEGKILQMPPSPATIVEKTGAGDAYATGFLGAYMLGKTIDEAMGWGASNAASVISKVGAQSGLLTKEALDKQIQGKSL